MSKSRHYYKLPGDEELPFGTCLAYVFFTIFIVGTIVFILWKAWG